MERFVQLIVAGGLALLAGLWLRELGDGRAAVQLLAVVLVVAGLGGLGAGIWSEVDV